MIDGEYANKILLFYSTTMYPSFQEKLGLKSVIQDTVVAQSGTLKPGKQITTMELLKNAAKKLSAGTYEGNFNVLYYNPSTGEKAIVNTEIPIVITVNP